MYMVFVYDDDDGGDGDSGIVILLALFSLVNGDYFQLGWFHLVIYAIYKV